jgi:antitoxin (DNA-binding transcriptional repressor) of toxin-antitoxin stability system
MHVPMNEFKSNLAKYIGIAKAGERVGLTSHKKVVAYVVGVPVMQNQRIQQMIASGAASWQGGGQSLMGPNWFYPRVVSRSRRLFRKIADDFVLRYLGTFEAVCK